MPQQAIKKQSQKQENVLALGDSVDASPTQATATKEEAGDVAIARWSGSFDKTSWTLFNADAVVALSQIPTDSVDCVITSPPYFWLRDYGVSGQIGLEETVADYVAALATVFDEVYRVLKPSGLLFLNLGDTYYSGKGKSHGIDRKSSKRRFGLRAVDKSGGLDVGLQRKSIIGIPWRVATELSIRNWVLRSPIIWHRLSSLPENAADRPSRGYEYVFMLAKSRKYYFDRSKLPSSSGSEDVWSIPPRPRSNGALETAPFPDALVAQCLDVGCVPGGTVLDPFAGSGTTIRVAASKGHPAIGIELSAKFCEHIRKMMEEETA